MRALRVFVLAVCLIIACSPSTAVPRAPSTPAPTSSAAAPTATDDRGHELSLRSAAMRIVSLVPGATEIVFALGQGARLVAVDEFSDYPVEARALTHLGGVEISAESVIAQRPDLVLVPTYLSSLAALDNSGAPSFVLEPADLEGVYRDISSIGALIGTPDRAKELVAQMGARLQAVADKARAATTRPRVLHEIDSTNPAQIYVAGPHNFIDAMITMAGGRNVAADATESFPKFSPEQIVARDPEVIVLSDAKYGATPAVVAARPGWNVISAVRQGAVYPIDDDLVSRFGPRLVLGYEAYLRLLHPELH
jgi:iron complex transport system substrate-binding protein